MVNGPTVIADFLEPFLLGISCMVGGEQFSLLLSHTKVSLKTQSFVLIVVSILSIIVSAFVDAEYSLFNGFHILYSILTVFLYVLVNEAFKSLCFVTLMTVLIGLIVSCLIIQSCSHYFTSRMQSLAFIYGLFISRSLPYMCWYFVNKNIPYESQLHSVATSLGSFRMIFCFSSMAIKIFLGRFRFPPIGSDMRALRGLFPYLSNGLKDLWNDQNLLWIPTKYYFSDKSNWLTFPFPSFLLYFFFMLSVIVYLAFPSLINSIYSVYSLNMVSLLTMIRAISHLFGSCFGIAFPISKSGTLSFLVVTGLSYVVVFLNLYFYYEFYDLPVLFFFELLTGFSLGYLWSYTLGIIINTSLNKNCIYQDHKDDCCCGDRINNECYCRLPFIVRNLKSTEHKKDDRISSLSSYSTGDMPSKTLFPCSTAIAPSGKSLRYSKDSNNAVLIFVGSNLVEALKTTNNVTCGDAENVECLKLLKIFVLDSVTTNSCPKCQLTVRLEARLNSDPLQCKSCPKGSICSCSSKDSGCCCLMFSCCSESCENDKCKVHFCCCKLDCAHCTKLSHSKDDTARLFMCFEGMDNNCSLKEIRPNDPTDFDGDFSKLNEFDILCLFFTDCCHVDFQVDLYCSMKNNFFRLTGINFPNKYTTPKSLILKNNNSKCMHRKDPQCCCIYRDLAIVSLSYNGTSSLSEKCIPINNGISQLGISNSNGHHGTHGHGSSSGTGSSHERCPELCCLQVDVLDSFYKKIYPNRAKLVVFCLLVFGLMFFITFLSISISRESRQPFTFKPTVTYSSLSGPFTTKKFNNRSQIINRLNSLTEIAKIADNIHSQKIKEFETMLDIFQKYMGDTMKSNLLKFTENQSNTFLDSQNIHPEFKRMDKMVIRWSYAVGLMYKYVFLHFFKIQKYFSVWEKNWSIEYKNYRKSIGLKIDKMSLKSKFSLTLLNDPKLSENKFNSIGISRLLTWNKVLKEVKLYSTLIEKELKLSVESLPLKLGTRLEHFILRWDHRIENILHWSKRMTNIYDWNNFLGQYNLIKEWVNDVSPYLKGNSDIRFPVKDLNVGTKVFSEYKID